MIQPSLNRQGRCMCWHPRFDVDDFARVFLPDQLRCRIVVLDTAGNPVTSFGRYGNVDDRGEGVPLADPRTVMVSDRAVYVGDMSNNRIARAELRYRAQAGCAVTLAGPAPTPSPAARTVRDEVAAVSSSLARRIDWTSLSGEADEIRGAVCRAAVAAGDLAPLEAYLKSQSRAARLAAVWALYGEKRGRSLLRRALEDDDELVRVAAADALLAAGDASGAAAIFEGASSKDPDVNKLAETVVLKKLVVWDPAHPQAGRLEPGKCYVARHPLGAGGVKALAELLVRLTRKDTRPEVKRARYWFMREKSIYLLALCGRTEAVPALLTCLRLEKKNPWGRNRNRLIGAMGLYRVREAVPDVLEFLARGRGSFILRDQGDRAEIRAAIALERIADPRSVAPIIALLDSPKAEVRQLSRRVLSRMFDPKIPADRCLVPSSAKLARVRVDKLPEPKALREAWRAFWKANAAKYPWNPKRPILSRIDG
jgi:HEAT repeat protein